MPASPPPPLTTAAAQYANAVRLYRQGDLHHARDVAETALLALSSLSEKNETGVAAESEREEVDATSFRIRSEIVTPYSPHAHLFGNLLLLLASIYMAVRDDAEAERLLATCEGYWRERLCCPVVTKKVKGRMSEESEPSRLDVREGLAGVAYNRAILKLEQLRASIADDGEGEGTRWSRRPSPDMIDALSPSALRVQHQQQQQQRVRKEATEILDRYVLPAKEGLRHTLGTQRLQLADVLHTCGVCHYYQRDYLTALTAWQQSLSIRVHVRRLLPSVLHTGPTSAVNNNDAASNAEERTTSSMDGVEELKAALTMEHIAHVYRLLPHKSLGVLKLYDSVIHTRHTYLGPTDALYIRALFQKGTLATELGHVKVARVLLDACAEACRRTEEMRERVPAELHRDVPRWREHLRTLE